MITYGYCRVSTKTQSLKRQQENIIKVYPEARLYSEAYTGTTMARPEWNKLISRLKDGDRIVFDSVSRMSRTAAEGWKTYENLYTNGIELVFLKEPHINSSVYRAALSRHIDIAANTGRKAIDKYIDRQAEALNELMLDLAKEQFQLAFEQSEKEVQDLHQRTAEGMRAAGAPQKIAAARQGKTFETPKAKAAKAAILKYSKDFNGSLKDTEVIKLAGISRNSYYKYKSELKN